MHGYYSGLLFYTSYANTKWLLLQLQVENTKSTSIKAARITIYKAVRNKITIEATIHNGVLENRSRSIRRTCTRNFVWCHTQKINDFITYYWKINDQFSHTTINYRSSYFQNVQHYLLCYRKKNLIFSPRTLQTSIT